MRALQSNVLVPADQLKVKVEKGWVSLSGTLDWDYQRMARPPRGVDSAPDHAHTWCRDAPVGARVSLPRAPAGDDT